MRSSFTLSLICCGVLAGIPLLGYADDALKNHEIAARYSRCDDNQDSKFTKAEAKLACL